MNTFIVTVRFSQPGVSGSRWSVRYIDTMWASALHAEDRKKELEGSLRIAGIDSADFQIAIVPGKIEDAKVQEAQQGGGE